MGVTVQSKCTVLLVTVRNKHIWNLLYLACLCFILSFLYFFFSLTYPRDWHVSISSDFTWYLASYWWWCRNQIVWYQWQEDLNFCSSKSCFGSLHKVYFGTIISISCEFGKDFLAMQTTGLKLLEWKFWSYQYMYCVCTILLIWNLRFLW